MCYGEAQRYCVDCDLTFCEDHFLDAHESGDKKYHEWRGADTDTVRRGCGLGVGQGVGLDLRIRSQRRSVVVKRL